MRGVQIKLRDPLRTRAIAERLRRCVHDKALYKSTFTFTFTFTLKAEYEDKDKDLNTDPEGSSRTSSFLDIEERDRSRGFIVESISGEADESVVVVVNTLNSGTSNLRLAISFCGDLSWSLCCTQRTSPFLDVNDTILAKMLSVTVYRLQTQVRCFHIAVTCVTQPPLLNYK